MVWKLDRLRAIHSEMGAEVDWVVECGTTVEDERGKRLFESFGLEPVRYFFDMFASTSDAPAPEYPPGMRAVPFTRDLTDELYDAHTEAFSDHWGFEPRELDRWVTNTIDSDAFRPDLSRLILNGKEIAAFVLSYDGAGDVLYIGQVGTRRAWRRRGLASALLADSMRAGADAGKPVAQLGVDADSPTGAVGLYERAGFAVKARFVEYEGPLNP